MSTTSLITLIFVGLLVFKVATKNTVAGPAPALDSGVPSKPQAMSQTDDAGAKNSLMADHHHQAPPAHVASQAGGGGPNQAAPTKSDSPSNKSSARSINAEKLRRGLTNFMNHLNPAPYFVPAQPAVTGKAGAAAGSQAEPATIINDGPTADALIKGPNRLVQARPLGGPLRWGR